MMKRMMTDRLGLLLCAACLLPVAANAQLNSNPDKFLGNITTGYQIDYGSEKFYQLWDQITPENETKWDQVEGNARGSFFWTNVDKIYKYAKDHKFPMKYHTLIWGDQYPKWMDKLSTANQYKAIVEWMDAAKKHCPDVQMIDVVNEAISDHHPAPYKEALGGNGKTGYDWIIQAFEMAHERWPDAILIYNDYNSFQWNIDQFIDLVRTLRDAGAPIDAYGCQSHDLNDCSAATLKSAMKKLNDALSLPMYVSEYDIDKTNDQEQLTRYKEQIPLLWEADYCAGVTLWGYIYGRTWKEATGLIKNGKDRSAMTWLRDYMKTDAAKTAKSPFPGGVKEASVYVRPATLNILRDEPLAIEVRARLKTKTIDHIDFYVKNQYYTTLTEAPYTLSYTPQVAGRLALKAVVVATDSSRYERLSGVNVMSPRTAYKGVISIPGTIQAENFDKGGEGYTYHDSDSKNEGTSYRSDGTGVDVVTGNGGYAIGYTYTGEWLEYSVDVKEPGTYTYEATVSSGSTSSGFSLSLVNADGSLTELFKLNVPQTGSDWSTYKTFKGNVKADLPAGPQTLRLTITGNSCNIDRIALKSSGTGIHTVASGTDGHQAREYNLAGQQVDDRYRGIVVRDGRKILK